ncbi:actin-domain-containing protein [Lactifluus volemus]|nr:actin-domain-containing protein [Lactifluus volemus]
MCAATMLRVNLCRPHDRRCALNLVRGARVHLPATAGRHRATGRCGDALEATQSAAVDVRAGLYKYIVLSGGSSMYPGLPSRLENEMKQLYLARMLNRDPSHLNKFKVRIADPSRRKDMVFLGCAVLSDIMKAREEFLVSREEWCEQGVRSLDKLSHGES